MIFIFYTVSFIFKDYINILAFKKINDKANYIKLYVKAKFIIAIIIIIIIIIIIVIVVIIIIIIIIIINVSSLYHTSRFNN